VASEVMLDEGNRTHFQRKRPILQSLMLGAVAALALCAAIPASLGQALPPGGGPLPELRRGTNGEIEAVRPKPASRPEVGQSRAAPAPKAAPAGSVLNRAAPAARGRAAPAPRQPVIMVAPVAPHIPDTSSRGAVVATYSVTMGDGSPFTGTVRFGAPYYYGGGVFALSDNKIIVNPHGPGVGPNRTTVTKHITLEAIP